MKFLANHRIARVAILGGGGIVAALLTTFIVVGLFVDLGGLIDDQLQAQAPKIKEKLGRELHFGKAHLKLLPTVRLELRDISIEAAPQQTGLLAQPLLTLGSLRARVPLFPLLFSLGRKVEVTSVEVNDLQIQVVRTAEGHLSYQDIIDKAATQPESPPMTQDEIDRLAGIVVERAALNDATVHFYDLSVPGGAATPLKLDSIQLLLENGQLFAPFTLTLDMAALSPIKNFHFAVTVGPLPHDLQLTQPLAVLRRAELTLAPIELEPLLRFLPPSPGVGLGRARIEAQLKLETPAHAGQLQLQAKFGAKGLVLQQGMGSPLLASHRGQPVDLGIDTQLSANLLAGDVQVEKLELTLGDMGVSAQADLRSLWTAPAVNKLALSSHGLLLERLVAALPPASVPANAVLRGPMLLHGSASGTPGAAQLEVAFDLTPATIMLPELAKPAGTALSLELRGQIKGAGAGADIERLGLTLGPLALHLRGHIGSASDIDLKPDSTVELDKLLRLLPTVERSVAKSGKIDGDLKVSATISKKQDALDLGARVTMTSARVDSGEIDLRGNADLSAKVHSTPQSSTVQADLDLTGAQLHVPGSVEKSSGVPMRLRAQIERSGEVVNVRLAELVLPGGTIAVVGRVDSGHNQLDLKIPPVELDLSRLAQVLPALRKGSLGGFLDSKLKIGVSFDGNPNKLGSARASLDQLDMTVAGGTVKGSAEVIGLDQPRKVTFKFVADRLDLDRIFPKSAEESHAEAEPQGHGGATEVPAFVRRLDLNGRVQVDSGRFRGTAVHDILMELTMGGGKLLIKTMRGQALGGTITASGSTVDFGPSKPRFSLHAKLDKIDVGEVMALRGGDLGKKLNGHGSVDLSADGQGLAWVDIAPRVTGLLGLGFTDAKLESASLGGQVIGPLVEQVGKRLGPNPLQKQMAMRDLAAQFRIENGRLHTNSPITMHTDEGGLSLTGSIGLDKTLALVGNLEVSPQTVSAATGGKFVPDQPISVGINIGGTLSSPQMGLSDPARTVGLLLAAIARGRGKEFLSGVAGGGLGKILNRGQPGGGGGLGNLLPGLGGQPQQPASGAPPSGAAAPPQPQPAPQDAVQQRIEQAKKSGLGGLFGR